MRAAVAGVVCILGVAAALGNGSGLNFIIMGDWGGQEFWPYYTEGEKHVAEQMGKKASEIGSQFTVALGDNFYLLGVTDVDDPRFKETYEDVFTASSLQSRWYMVCGNHDHYGNASAEVAYTARSKRWYMPNFYYTEIITIPDTNATVQFVLIDTVLLAGVTDLYDKSLPPKGPASWIRAEEQWVWINETLRNSKADWLIVAGHYPVWSIAEHGPTQVLVDRLRPMLMEYKVSAYFCGHDHNLQYIQESNSSVSYFVVGAAHLIDDSTAHKDDIPAGSLKYHYGPFDLFDSKGGFSTVNVTATSMTVTFFDYEGNKLYSVSRPKIR